MDRLMGAISLAKKAGKLACGYTPVLEAAEKGRLCLLLFTEDYAEKSRNKTMQALRGCLGTEPLAHTLPYGQHELATITRKAVGVLAVTDEGLAGLCRKHME